MDTVQLERSSDGLAGQPGASGRAGRQTRTYTYTMEQEQPKSFTYLRAWNDRVGFPYEDWMLLVEDVPTLLAWQEKVGDPGTAETMKEALMDGTDGYETKDTLARFALMAQDAEGRGAIQHVANMKARAFLDRLRHVMAGKKLLVNDAGGYMFLGGDIVETDRMVVDRIGGYRYTEQDIRLLRFRNGSHWYAKIGKMDVVDEYGNQKWNTRGAARRAAEKFLADLK